MNSYTTFSGSTNDRFIRFSNMDGKAWVVPLKNMRCALNLYQPSSVKGRLVKSFMPYLYWVPFFRSLAKIENREIALDGQLKSLLSRVLGIEEFEFSIFEGTPSVHQKVTIQIFSNGKIVGYCKLSQSSEIISLFNHECEVLRALHHRGVGCIPECIYLGTLGGGSASVVFVQTTIKTNGSKIVHSWSDEHQKFLECLHRATEVRLPFLDSDFARSLAQLEGFVSILPTADRSIVVDAMGYVREYYGTAEVGFSAYHADFTPWNMFLEAGELFVFDFEYAAMSYPPYLDRYHFLTQVAIFEKHLSPEQIVEELKALNIVDFQTGYRSYLLDVISKYINRERGQLSNSTRERVQFWIDILKEL